MLPASWLEPQGPCVQFPWPHRPLWKLLLPGFLEKKKRKIPCSLLSLGSALGALRTTSSSHRCGSVSLAQTIGVCSLHCLSCCMTSICLREQALRPQRSVSQSFEQWQCMRFESQPDEGFQGTGYAGICNTGRRYLDTCHDVPVPV